MNRAGTPGSRASGAAGENEPFNSYLRGYTGSRTSGLLTLLTDLRQAAPHSPCKADMTARVQAPESPQQGLHVLAGNGRAGTRTPDLCCVKAAL